MCTDRLTERKVTDMTLCEAREGTEYTVSRLETEDQELDAFLFSLGCYPGAPVTVVTRRKRNLTVAIKDGRYNMDSQLANAIVVK